MDRKTKFLFFLIIIISTLSVTATYYRYVVLKDFDVYILEEDTDGEFHDLDQVDNDI